MKLGIDLLLQTHAKMFSGKRLGVLAHQASVDTNGRHTVDRLCEVYNVTALFGPEHGLTTYAQDMEAVDSTTDAKRGLPVFSLYGSTVESLSPTPDMLKLIDVLIVDLQDIGSRYYTYIWTTLLAMKVCAKLGKKVIVCDRPNPLGGATLEGGKIDSGYESFVGMYSLPVRHALTLGELVTMMNTREKIHCPLEIISMEGWKRQMHWPDTKLSWINPSPNMRSYEAALLYPGMCLLEATNASEGRGTDTPFEIIGAPYVRGEEFAEHFAELQLPGIQAHATIFTPTFQKWAKEKCQGVQWKIIDTQKFKPYLTGLATLWLLHKLYQHKGFAWRVALYEFVKNIPAIDLLTGNDAFRKRISTRDFAEIEPLADPLSSFETDRAPYLLY